jgi:hypothetical protein
MKTKKKFQFSRDVIISSPSSILIVVLFVASNLNAGDNKRVDIADSDSAAVDHSVQDFMDAVARDITAKGPRAWRDYLSASPAFLMASNGELVFANGDAAQKGIAALEQTIQRIELQWGHELHIDVLAENLAAIGVPFHELLVQKTGQRTSVDGYFTALAQRSDHGWQFRNAHWSVPPSAPLPK